MKLFWIDHKNLLMRNLFSSMGLVMDRISHLAFGPPYFYKEKQNTVERLNYLEKLKASIIEVECEGLKEDFWPENIFVNYSRYFGGFKRVSVFPPSCLDYGYPEKWNLVARIDLPKKGENCQKLYYHSGRMLD